MNRAAHIFAALAALAPAAIAQDNSAVRFSMESPASYSEVGPGEIVEISISASNIAGASQVEIVLELDPAEAFDLTLSTFSTTGSPFYLAPGLDPLGEGTVRGGGASPGDTVSGDGLLGTFRIVTAAQFTVQTPASISVDLISIGMSVTQRDEFTRAELGMRVLINPDAPPVMEPGLAPVAPASVSATLSPLGSGAAIDASPGEVNLGVSFTAASGDAAAGRPVEWSITNNGSETVYAHGSMVTAISSGGAFTTSTVSDLDGLAAIVLDAEGDGQAAPTSASVVATARATNSQGVSRVLTIAFAVTWDIPVPAEFSHLAADRIDATRIRLSWGVPSQTSNVGWEIYRQSGEAPFERVDGLIPGQGTTDEYHTYEFVDTPGLGAVGAHRYLLKQIDLDGTAGYSQIVQLAGNTAAIPGTTALHQNYPNPFNAQTRIDYELAAFSPVALVVYDALGRIVRPLVSSSMQSPGRHTVIWDGRDGLGKRASSGVYFLVIRGAEFERTRKLVLVE